MEVKIFNTETCTKLLDYKFNQEMRNQYNNDVFNYAEISYLNESIELALDKNDFQLGTRSIDDFESSQKIFESLRCV